MTDPKMHFAFAIFTAIIGLIMLGTVWLNFFAQGKKRQFHYIRLPLLFGGIGFCAFVLTCQFLKTAGLMFVIAFIASVAFLTTAMLANGALQPQREAPKEPGETNTEPKAASHCA